MPKPPETYTEAETETRREAALKVMLASPHKPHNGGAKSDRKSGASSTKS